MASSARSVLGLRGEALARAYLTERGFTLLGSNVRIGREEVDLIMRDRATLVFVEVKTRTSDLFGTPEEAVTARKLMRLERALARYLREHPTIQAARIDVVAVAFHSPDSPPEIRHLRAVGPGRLALFS